MPTYRVTIGEKAYNVEVPNPRERPVRAIVDGEVIEVTLETSAAAPTERVTAAPMPAIVKTMPSVNTGAAGEIKAPLPGTVLRISVAEGAPVTRGQELCVLEAMKMNNPIRATQAGTVKKILVSVGQQVPHGAVLLVLES